MTEPYPGYRSRGELRPTTSPAFLVILMTTAAYTAHAIASIFLALVTASIVVGVALVLLVYTPGAMILGTLSRSTLAAKRIWTS